MSDWIQLKEVSTNNLKGIDVKFPLQSFTVVTGVSGSGKSSLVFDSLYGESYRRYVESLSSFARQYMQSIPQPVLKDVENLPASIAVMQARGGGNSNRSTVGTMTELGDLLRIIFAYLSQVYCCGNKLIAYPPEVLAGHLIERYNQQKILFLAPLSSHSSVKPSQLKADLLAQGFTRVYQSGQVSRLEDLLLKDIKKAYVVVDRVKVSPGERARILESSLLAYRLGRSYLSVQTEDGFYDFSEKLYCSSCSKEYDEPSPGLLNYNSPQGACPTCEGFGRVPCLDPDKIIPDPSKSLQTQGVAPFNFGKPSSVYSRAIRSAEARGLDPQTPFHDYSEEDLEWLYEGDTKTRYAGINGFFEWLDSKKYKMHYRVHIARFYTYETCDACQGGRLSKKANQYYVQDLNYSTALNLSLGKLCAWVDELGHQPSEENTLHKFHMGLEDALNETLMRLNYLVEIGLEYLHLNRPARTLSGGETQRIQMARSLGSQLTGTLFCLDEPSSGLHPRDSHRLVSIIKKLRDQGNTIVVVEHERALIEAADHLIEIGPQAGVDGGNLVYEGDPASNASQKEIYWSFSPFDAARSACIGLNQISTNNLKNVTAAIPEASLTVVCGVSGSGKTSLVRHSLYPLLCKLIGKQVNLDMDVQGRLLSPREGWTPEQVILMSQEPIGRSSRSNIATYLGIYTEIRKLFASTPLAKAQGFGPGHFSFNVAGGRCEECKGLGLVEEDLSFLGSMMVRCSSCEGKRFQDEVLEVEYDDKNLLDILAMTVEEAMSFFFNHKKIYKVLKKVEELGMSYLCLGQATSSFSGGEAQRLKILSFLVERKHRDSSVFIFDEPTSGLSDHDITYLLAQFKALAESGHTVVVVEHHLGVIKSADWLIELGPEAGAKGGELVFQGHPKALLDCNTATAHFLKSVH